MNFEIIEAIRAHNEKQVTELREMTQERDEALQELASFRAAVTCALFDDHHGDLPSVAELVEEIVQLKQDANRANVVRVELSPEAFGLLYRLTGIGIFGRDPNEVAARFIDQALQAFVEQPKIWPKMS